MGRGFIGVEVGHGEVVRGELGSDMDSNETSVVGFFGGVGYFGMGFFGDVVQVVGFVWRGSNGLWCGDCCLMWWKSAWSCEH